MNFIDPVIFDIESTGVDPRTCEIIQIAALAPLSNDKFEVKIKFEEKEEHYEALECNSYDEDIWDDEAVVIPVALQMFTEYLKKHASQKRESERGYKFKTVAGMGYNCTRFDAPLIQRYFKERSLFIPMDYVMYDVYQLALWKLPGLKQYTLTKVAKHLNCLRENAHDATADVEMTADITALLLYDEDAETNLRWVKRRIRQLKRRWLEELKKKGKR